MSLIAITLAAALLGAADTPPAPAQPSAPVAAQAAAPPKTAEVSICRTEEVVGSRMRKRICRTQAEWDREDGLSRGAYGETGGSAPR